MGEGGNFTKTVKSRWTSYFLIPIFWYSILRAITDLLWKETFIWKCLELKLWTKVVGPISDGILVWRLSNLKRTLLSIFYLIMSKLIIQFNSVWQSGVGQKSWLFVGSLQIWNLWHLKDEFTYKRNQTWKQYGYIYNH